MFSPPSVWHRTFRNIFEKTYEYWLFTVKSFSLTVVTPRNISSQVRSDYMQYHASKVSDGMALQLGCLELRWVTFLEFRYYAILTLLVLCSPSHHRKNKMTYQLKPRMYVSIICLVLALLLLFFFHRRFYKDMNAKGLEKKSNFELLEWVLTLQLSSPCHVDWKLLNQILAACLDICLL